MNAGTNSSNRYIFKILCNYVTLSLGQAIPEFLFVIHSIAQRNMGKMKSHRGFIVHSAAIHVWNAPVYWPGCAGFKRNTTVYMYYVRKPSH